MAFFGAASGRCLLALPVCRRFLPAMRRWLFFRQSGAGLAGCYLQMVCPKMVCLPKKDDQRIDAHHGLLALAFRRFSAFPNAIEACRGGLVSMGFCDQALKIPMVHLHNVADDLFWALKGAYTQLWKETRKTRLQRPLNRSIKSRKIAIICRIRRLMVKCHPR